VRRITVSYHIALTVVFNIAYQRRHSDNWVYGTAVTMGNRFLSTTGSRTLAFGYRRYGRPTVGTAGFLVNHRALVVPDQKY